MRKMIRVANPEPFVAKDDDDMIICRCEEITKGEIRKAVYDGMRTTNEVKRYLRAGMGLCQGQTCQRLVQGIIAALLGGTLPLTGYYLWIRRIGRKAKAAPNR